MIPNGATLSVGSAFGAALAISAISNASPAVADLPADHGLTAGKLGILKVNWGRLLGKVAKVQSVSGAHVTLTGIDTDNENLFVPGGGVGTFTEITAFTTLPKVTNFKVDGGEQQYETNQWLDSEVEEQERTIRSAKKLGFQIKDDPEAAWYPVLKRLSDEEVETAFRLSLKNGRSIFYSGVLSVGDSPSVEQNKTMLLQVDMAILSAGISRY